MGFLFGRIAGEVGVDIFGRDSLLRMGCGGWGLLRGRATGTLSAVIVLVITAARAGRLIREWAFRQGGSADSGTGI